MVQNGSDRLSRAVFPNGEVHHGGLRGRIHSLDPDQPTLLGQLFCHPTDMDLRVGQSTKPAAAPVEGPFSPWLYLGENKTMGKAGNENDDLHRGSDHGLTRILTFQRQPSGKRMEARGVARHFCGRDLNFRF